MNILLAKAAPETLDGRPGHNPKEHSGHIAAATEGPIIYIDDNWQGIEIGTDPDGPGPAQLFGQDAFASIQEGIHALTTTGTVLVASGTYSENIIIDRSLTLQGPNAGLDPNTGARVAEAIVIPISNTTVLSSPASVILRVEADHVTIDGFTLDGDNPHSVSGIDLNGADANAAYGISNWEALPTGITITNNIVRNLVRSGIRLFGDNARPTYGTITNNLVDNIPLMGTEGQGINTGQNFYANISDNVLTRVYYGIQYRNFWQPTYQHPSQITNNRIQATYRGIWFSQHTQQASATSITSNTISAENDIDIDTGIRINHIRDNVAVLVENNTIQNANTGLLISDTQGSHINVLSNTLMANRDALVLESSTITMTSTTISSNENGILIANASFLSATHNTIINNRIVGVLLTDTSNTHLHNNALCGNHLNVDNRSSREIDARGNWWGTNTPAPDIAYAGLGNYSQPIQFNAGIASLLYPSGGTTLVTATLRNGTYAVVDGFPLTFTTNSGLFLENAAQVYMTHTLSGKSQATWNALSNHGLITVSLCCDYRYVITPTYYRVFNINSSEWFTGIQAALDNVNTQAGDAISITTGRYNEHVQVDKNAITLVGAADNPNERTVLDGGSLNNPYETSGIKITPGTQNITIKSLHVKNFDIGIDVNQGEVVLIDNVADNNGIGLRITGSTIKATNNTISNNANVGILFTGTEAISATLGGSIQESNTFLNNGSDHQQHITVTLPNNAPPILAYSNNWGASTLDAIEDSIYHKVDDAALTEVRYFAVDLATAAGEEPVDDQGITVTARLIGALPTAGHVISFASSSGTLNTDAARTDDEGKVSVWLTPSNSDTVTVTASAGMSARNIHSDTIVIQFKTRPILILTKTDNQFTARPGERLTYTIKLTNIGFTKATDIALTDTLPISTTFIQASNSGQETNGIVAWPAFDLAAGKSTTRTLALSVPITIPDTISILSNRVNATEASGISASARDIDVLLGIAIADLEITKDDNKLIVEAGEHLTYTLTITNHSPLRASGIRITDTLPEVAEVITISHGGILTNGDVIWPVTDLSGNETLSRTVTIQLPDLLPSDVITISNYATVSDDGSKGNDQTPDNNRAVDIDWITGFTDLRIQKDVSQFYGCPGELITYTLRIENIGVRNTSGVVITDVLPAYTHIISTSGGGAQTNGVITWPTFDLEAGDSVILTLTTQIDAAAPNNKVLTNTAYVTYDGSTGTEATPDNNQDSAIILVQQYLVYMPAIVRQYTPGPDLVVDEIQVVDGQITVTIRNQGDLSIADNNSFWIDLYLNPDPPPEHVNQTWQTVAQYGATWGIVSPALPLEPGETLKVRTGEGEDYYRPEYSRLPLTIPPNSVIYAQVDSANAGISYGAVLENHEIINGPYNNIAYIILSDTTSLTTNHMPADGASLGKSDDNLPNRP